jgi:hypothetical protein
VCIGPLADSGHMGLWCCRHIDIPFSAELFGTHHLLLKLLHRLQIQCRSEAGEIEPLERPRAGSEHAHSSLQDLATHTDQASKKQLPCLLYVDLQYGPAAAGCKSLTLHKLLILDLPELAHTLVSITDGWSCVLHLLALDFLSTRSNRDPSSAPPNLLFHAFIDPPSLKYSRLSLPPFQKKRDL